MVSKLLPSFNSVLTVIFLTFEFFFPARADCGFSSGPANMTLTVGQTNVVLSCTVNTSPIAIIWIHSLNGEELNRIASNFGDEDGMFEFDNGDLKFPVVSTRHHGEYYCNLQTPCSHVFSPTGYIEVTSPILIEYVDDDDDTIFSADVEKSLTILLRMFGSPQPQLTLFKQKISSSKRSIPDYEVVDDPRISFSTTGVTFSSLEFTDEGTYLLAAENSEGTTNISFTVDVAGATNITSLSVNRQQSTNVSAYLTWLLTPSNATVSSYRIRYRIKGSQSFTIISDQDTSDTAYRVEGLSPGVEYEFGVSAIDLSDSTQDIFSTSVFFATFRRPVDVPTNLWATRTDSYIILQWNEPTDVPTYAPITGYDIIYHTSEDSSPQTVSIGDETIYNLPNNENLSYFFTLRATNEWGEGVNASFSLLVVKELNINRQQSTNVSVYLMWSIHPPNATVSSYQIKYRMRDDQSMFATISVTDTSDTTHIIGGLSPGVEYEFRVDANGNNDGTQNSVHFTTFRRPIDAPANIKATRNQTSIILDWSQPSNVPIYAPITGYDVIYHTSEDSSLQTVSIEGNESSYSLARDNSLSYFFTLRATNEWGESDPVELIVKCNSSTADFSAVIGAVLSTLLFLAVVVVCAIVAITLFCLKHKRINSNEEQIHQTKELKSSNAAMTIIYDEVHTYEKLDEFQQMNNQDEINSNKVYIQGQKNVNPLVRLNPAYAPREQFAEDLPAVTGRVYSEVGRCEAMYIHGRRQDDAS